LRDCERLFIASKSECRRDTAIAGIRATDLVSNIRSQKDTFKSRNPSITNCPARVPETVLACAAAKRPTAKRTAAFSGRIKLRAFPAFESPISEQNPGFPEAVMHAVPDPSLEARQPSGPEGFSEQVGEKKACAKDP
jgi:hypothetical protein